MKQTTGISNFVFFKKSFKLNTLFKAVVR